MYCGRPQARRLRQQRRLLHRAGADRRSLATGRDGAQERRYAAVEHEPGRAERLLVHRDDGRDGAAHRRARGGVARCAVREGGDVSRGARPDTGRRVLPRGVRAPLGVRFRLRKRADEGDHGARAAVRAAAPEHRRRRGGAGPARQLQVRRRGTPGAQDGPHPRRHSRRAAALARDGGEDGRAADRERAGDGLPLPADRAHDEHLHRAAAR